MSSLFSSWNCALRRTKYMTTCLAQDRSSLCLKPFTMSTNVLPKEAFLFTAAATILFDNYHFVYCFVWLRSVLGNGLVDRAPREIFTSIEIVPFFPTEIVRRVWTNGCTGTKAMFATLAKCSSKDANRGSSMPIGWRRSWRKWVRNLRILRFLFAKKMLCESISNLQAAFFKNPQSKDSHQPPLI